MPQKKAAGAGKNANRKKFLTKTRERLLEMKNKLLAEFETELRAEREANKDEGMDTYDLASEERDRGNPHHEAVAHPGRRLLARRQLHVEDVPIVHAR